MSRKRFAFASSLVASALTFGLVATTALSAPASAKPGDDTSDPTLALTRTSGKPSPTTPGATGQWPEAEVAGDIYIGGKTRGYAFFDDWDADHHDDHMERDDFYVVDRPDDGFSVSLTIYHDGEEYTDHAYYGETKFIDVGNISNGETVTLKGCAWDNGVSKGCAESQLTE